MTLPRLLIALLLAPQAALACSVCMGQQGSDLQRGFYWGILILLILPFALFAFIAVKVVSASRRKVSLPPASDGNAL